jgi:hypothetical protein
LFKYLSSEPRRCFCRRSAFTNFGMDTQSGSWGAIVIGCLRKTPLSRARRNFRPIG